MGSPWGSRLQHARRERLTHAKYAFLLSSVSRVIRTLRAWSNWAKAARCGWKKASSSSLSFSGSCASPEKPRCLGFCVAPPLICLSCE